MACSCFLLGCEVCFAAQPAVCSCFLLTCPVCTGESHLSKQRFVVRKVLKTDKYKRTVQADVNLINQSGRACVSNHGNYVRSLKSQLLNMRPSWSAMQEIGRDIGERWEFMEIFSGCSRLSKEVAKFGGKCGPAVDCLPSADLRLDLSTPSTRALLWQLVKESRVRWIHLGFPCTFFINRGRCTALRTHTQWEELRETALGHMEFSIHLLREQETEGRDGSMEQPRNAGSWRCRGWTELENSSFQKYIYDSCAFGLCDEDGRPLQKPGALGSNRDLSTMERQCCCGVPHGRVEGSVQQGPEKGRRRSEVAGQYTLAFCQAFAREILRSRI